MASGPLPAVPKPSSPPHCDHRAAASGPILPPGSLRRTCTHRRRQRRAGRHCASSLWQVGDGLSRRQRHSFHAGRSAQLVPCEGLGLGVLLVASSEPAARTVRVCAAVPSAGWACCHGSPAPVALRAFGGDMVRHASTATTAGSRPSPTDDAAAAGPGSTGSSTAASGGLVRRGTCVAGDRGGAPSSRERCVCAAANFTMG